MALNLVSLAVAILNLTAVVFLLWVFPAPRPVFARVLVVLSALCFVTNLLFGIGVF